MTKLIKQLVPSFCWQTTLEILTMLEGVDDTVELDLVSAMVSKLTREGILECRPVRTPRFPGQAVHVPRGTKLHMEYKMPDCSICLG